MELEIEIVLAKVRNIIYSIISLGTILPSMEVDMEIGGSPSATIVSNTTRDSRTVRTYDNFSPDSTGTTNTSATSSDVRNIGRITFKL